MTRATAVTSLTLAALAVSLVLALTIGASGVTPLALLHGSGGASPEQVALARTILLAIRLPRAVTAALCGGALAAAGVTSQGLFAIPWRAPRCWGRRPAAA